jgi:hypothetical protein
MHTGVLFALYATHFAGSDTCLKLIPPQACFNGRLPGHNPPGRFTYVSTVQVETDTTDQFLNLRLAQAGVGTKQVSMQATSVAISTWL